MSNHPRWNPRLEIAETVPPEVAEKIRSAFDEWVNLPETQKFMEQAYEHAVTEAIFDDEIAVDHDQMRDDAQNESAEPKTLLGRMADVIEEYAPTLRQKFAADGAELRKLLAQQRTRFLGEQRLREEPDADQPTMVEKPK